jgi:hypothetical protein
VRAASRPTSLPLPRSATLESAKIRPLVTPVQSDIAQRPVVEVPHLHPQICAVQPHDDAALHLLPNAKRFPVCLAHGSALGLEINYNCNLAAGWGIAVMHNTKLHLAHKGLKLVRHNIIGQAGCPIIPLAMRGFRDLRQDQLAERLGNGAARIHEK